MNSAVMRSTAEGPDPAVRLSCAQVWAGNRQRISLLELPGLTAWVYSSAAGPGTAGGDVHYISVCPRCLVTRVALADVSGHGHSVATFSNKLGSLMKKHLHAIKQVPLMQDLNKAVREVFRGEHYATMVAIGWHRRWSIVSMSNAGHPPPLWYSDERDEWNWLESGCPGQPDRLRDLPLGLLDDSGYSPLVFKVNPGDLFVLYSDGITEAVDAAGNELGQSGLVSLARSLDHTSVSEFGVRLVSALDGYRNNAVQTDDQTIIVVRRNQVKAEAE